MATRRLKSFAFNTKSAFPSICNANVGSASSPILTDITVYRYYSAICRSTESKKLN
eukprot:m.189240 g.189240  ORF g.189240 m.189240 type:complete len:56 (-) comp16740_c0_seq2:265-432(-)